MKYNLATTENKAESNTHSDFKGTFVPRGSRMWPLQPCFVLLHRMQM